MRIVPTECPLALSIYLNGHGGRQASDRGRGACKYIVLRGSIFFLDVLLLDHFFIPVCSPTPYFAFSPSLPRLYSTNVNAISSSPYSFRAIQPRNISQARIPVTHKTRFPSTTIPTRLLNPPQAVNTKAHRPQFLLSLLLHLATLRLLLLPLWDPD